MYYLILFTFVAKTPFFFVIIIYATSQKKSVGKKCIPIIKKYSNTAI